MKKTKFCVLLAAAAVTLGMVLSGCGGNGANAGQTPSATVQLKDGQSLETVVNRIEEEIGIAMPAEVDETALQDVFYVSPGDAESYYGKFSMVMVSADNVMAVQAAEGKVETVKAALEKRLEDVRASFEMYLPDQFEKSEKGQVYAKGDYLFLLVLGESPETFDSDMEKAKQIIDEAFA